MNSDYVNTDNISFEEIENKLEHIRLDLLDEYKQPHSYPWVVGYSGGKDSTLVLQLVYEMLLDLAPGDRKRDIHIVANDTLVESPLIIKYLDKMIDKLKVSVDTLQLPIKLKKTTPSIDQTFWVNLIGRGYPAPNRNFRWCTDRMKINPTSEYIKTTISEHEQVILLLGVRREESAKRAESVNRYSNGARLNKHNDLKGCMVYRPIVDITTDEVWQILLQRRPPWGGTHRELITLYKNAQGGECPLVIDKSQAPSCGTSSSRFGCWTCTVVAKDKSMEGFIDSGYGHLTPLLDFRDWLSEIRDDPTKRMARRRGGTLTFMTNGKLIPGPFTFETRKEILDKLLAIQNELGEPLITEEEIVIINQIWAEDALVVGGENIG
jgi:putative sulfurtransferase DndC